MEEKEKDKRDTIPAPPLPSKDRLAAVAAKLENAKLDPVKDAAKEPEPSIQHISPEPCPVPFLGGAQVGQGVYLPQQTAELSHWHEWTDTDDDQLITYIKSSSSYKEIAKKMNMEVWQIVDRCATLRHLREHFHETKKILGR